MTKIFQSTVLIVIFMMVARITTHAAVNDVTYKIVYNSTTCLYDVIMTVTNGSTTSIDEQQAFTAQVSIVVPLGTTVGTASIVSNEPKTSVYTPATTTPPVPASLVRGLPSGWTYTNSQSFIDASSTAVIVYAFTVSTSNAYYPSLATNSQTTLFSIPISTTSCGSGIRLWRNNIIQGVSVTGGDPVSSTSGFSGKDYNNGITFSFDPTVANPGGGFTQTYSGNGTSVTTQPGPIVNAPSFTASCISNTATITATAVNNGCSSGTLTAAWTTAISGVTLGSPTSTTSGTPAVLTTSITASAASVPLLAGNYVLTVTNSRGCSSSQIEVLAPNPCNITPLAIDLANFTAVANNCSALLSWEASNAVNFQRFDVQYSGTGIEYTTVGQVAYNKSNTSGSYSFPYQQADRKGYYRLRMVDMDGKATYSKVISVTTDCGNNDKTPVISIAPNPTTGIAKVSGIETGDEIRVVDMMGNLVVSITASGNSSSVNMSKYPAGIYGVLIVHNQAIVKSDRLIKQ